MTHETETEYRWVRQRVGTRWIHIASGGGYMIMGAVIFKHHAHPDRVLIRYSPDDTDKVGMELGVEYVRDASEFRNSFNQQGVTRG